MGHGLIADILAWVAAHPVAAISVVFAVALAESLFLLGLLVPGAVFMFAFGALAGSHVLSSVAVFAAGIVGTLLGDGLSYALGRRYQGRLAQLPGLSRLPGGIARGEAFFSRHGGKGIILGRLIGALRPVMPTIAGAAGLTPLRFVVMDAVATVLWAALYIAPGVLVGASMNMAAQLATRLLVVVLLAGLLVWGLTTAARFLIVTGRALGRRYADALLGWSAAHRRLGLLGPALADPRQPELPALTVAAALTALAVAIGYGLVGWGPTGTGYPGRFDALVYWLLTDLHNTPVDALARPLAQLATPAVYGPLAVATAGVLLWNGNWRAGAQWIVALVLTAAIVAPLVAGIGPARPVVFYDVLPGVSLGATGGGAELLLPCVVYGLGGAMLGLRAGEPARTWLYSAAVALTVTLALARLYLGLAWASDLLIGLPAAFVWINLLLLAYRRQRPRRIASRLLAGLFGLAVLASLSAADSAAGPIARLGTRVAAPSTSQRLADWPGYGYARLADRIETVQGRPGPPINVQASATRQALIAGLARAGWQLAPPLGATQLLHSLVPSTPVGALAVWPTLHAGRTPTLTFVHASRAAEQRWVLRFWASGAIDARHDTPIWLGVIDRQSRREDFRLMVTARDQAGYDRAGLFLATQLAAHGIDVRWAAATGQPPLLIEIARAPGPRSAPPVVATPAMLK